MLKIFFKKYSVYISIFLIIAALFVGAVVGKYESDQVFKTYLSSFRPLRRGGERFKYVNPLVGVESPSSFDVGMNLDIKEKIEGIISDYQKRGLKKYAIYFRDLNTSVWFGFNDDEEFSPASLLKLSIALSVYRYGEDRQDYLDSQVLFTKEIADIGKQRANNETILEVGKSYSVRELVEDMLVNSDNSARDLLVTTIPDKYVELVYTYLNIPEPSPQLDFRISLNNYALLMRLLYSSTFITAEHSEELLAILTKTNFPYGITRDLPSDIPVAHKYGVYNLPKDDDGVALQQLHDCGIIYQLSKPYLLCVMTQGPDQAVLADFIATVSKAVYKFTLKQQ